ncbi:MAG: 16S rRNA (guanine(527)-N(7))-methyltransferase RsmG [Victivallaceae bacterium]|nr:16S rRNA (guanine(527)-N(7))-methyltransferase RsmG [Victivallaceae bacterium]
MLLLELDEFWRQCGVADLADFNSRTTRLYELLLAANREANLTRIQTETDYWIKHVADSLTIARCFPQVSREELRVADLGCGAGFPSLVLAAAFPKLKVTAIDSAAKKTAFVRRAADELGLPNLEVVTGRGRELNRQAAYRGQFDLVTARAVSDLRSLFRETRRFIRPGGRFIFYKTPEPAAAELPQLKTDSRKYAFDWQTTEVFSLPGNCGERQLVYSI